MSSQKKRSNKRNKKKSIKKPSKINSKKKTIKQKSKYYYLVKSDYFNPKKINAIFDKRGQVWEPFNELLPQKEDPDFLYLDDRYMYDKSLFRYNVKLKNIIDLNSDNHSISDKRNLYNNLISLNNKSLNKHLMKQYELNLYNMFKGKDNIENYKSLFKNNKIWILKPIYGAVTRGIKIIKNYDMLKNTINKFISKNQYTWKNMNYKKYEKLRDLEKYEYYIEWVLQEYIMNPFLYKKKKTRFRVYFIYDLTNKLKKAYILDYVELALAKKDYVNKDFYNKDIHTELHNTSPYKYIYFPRDIIKLVGKEKADHMLKQIKFIFKNVFKCIKAKCYSESKKCFYIFGADIFFTDTLQAKLIEVNHKPSLNVYDDENNKTHYTLFENIMEKIVDKHFIPSKKVKTLNNFIDIPI